MKIIWIMNGCGLVKDVVTGGPIRLHAISSRWNNKENVDQILLTTIGGKGLAERFGSILDMKVLPASILLKNEPFLPFRLYSYIITSLFAKLKTIKLIGNLESNNNIIITASDYFCDIIPAIIIKKKYQKSKWIAWIHHRETNPKKRPGNRIVNSLMYSIQKWSLKKIAHFADEAWTYETEAGDYVFNELINSGMQDNQIHRMKCGIELKEITKDDIKKQVDAVMIGVRPNKGMHDITPVWKEVIKQRPGTTLRLMGGMVDIDLLIKKFKEEGLNNVITVFKPKDGYMDTKIYYETIKEASIMFAPSREEGWGIAVCEAMACGLPVVGYDLPTYRQIYNDSFIKIPIGDTELFAHEICRILDSKVEFDKYQNKGFECSKKYDWDLIANEDWEYINK